MHSVLSLGCTRPLVGAAPSDSADSADSGNIIDTREDFPARNDRDWLNRTLAHWKDGDTLPTLTYEEASPTMELPPGDRGYGKSEIIPMEAPKGAEMDAPKDDAGAEA